MLLVCADSLRQPHIFARTLKQERRPRLRQANVERVVGEVTAVKTRAAVHTTYYIQYSSRGSA